MTPYFRFCDRAGELYLRTFPVIRRTAKGAWVDDYGVARFVLDGGHRRHCYPTEDAAWASFKIRKYRQREHLQRALDRLSSVDERTKMSWREALGDTWTSWDWPL